MNEYNSFRQGIKDGFPIFLAYFAVSFAFGLYAVESGLTVVESVFMSITNLASAGQFAAVPIIVGGGSFIELAATQLIINIRYTLMSLSLSQKLGKRVKFIDKLLIGFVVTDEIFGVAVSKEGTVGKRYMFGLIMLPVVGWAFGTFLGAAAGNILPELLISALGIAIYGMFIAIILPQVKSHLPTALCVIGAIGLGCAFKFIPALSVVSDGFVIIICSVVMSLLFAFIAPIRSAADSSDKKEGGNNG